MRQMSSRAAFEARKLSILQKKVLIQEKLHALYLRRDGRRRADAARSAARDVRRRNWNHIKNAVYVVRATVHRHC